MINPTNRYKKNIWKLLEKRGSENSRLDFEAFRC